MSTPSRSKYMIKDKIIWKHTLTQHLVYMFLHSMRLMARLGSPQGQAALPSPAIIFFFFVQNSLINKMF